MMLTLADIRDYISELGDAEDDNVYIGKLDNKKQKSIGIYARKTSGSPDIAIGGWEATTHATRPVSILIHWSKSLGETEKAAFGLFEKLSQETSVTIHNTRIDMIRLMVPEPQDTGTDDSGVYEYVIWVDFIYERKE